MLEERLRTQLRLIRSQHGAGKKLNTNTFKKFLVEQETFLKRTNEEIVEDDKVRMGHIDELNIPDCGTEPADETLRSAKRAKLEGVA